MPCEHVEASTMGNGLVCWSDTLHALEGSIFKTCGMVGTRTRTMHVFLGGSSWVWDKIFPIIPSLFVRIFFPCGYTGSKVSSGALGEALARSVTETLGCDGCLGGSVSLAGSYRHCDGLASLSSTGSPQHLPLAFIHSPYGLVCCSGLMLGWCIVSSHDPSVHT